MGDQHGVRQDIRNHALMRVGQGAAVQVPVHGVQRLRGQEPGGELQGQRRRRKHI